MVSRCCHRLLQSNTCPWNYYHLKQWTVFSLTLSPIPNLILPSSFLSPLLHPSYYTLLFYIKLLKARRPTKRILRVDCLCFCRLDEITICCLTCVGLTCNLVLLWLNYSFEYLIMEKRWLWMIEMIKNCIFYINGSIV